MFFNSNILKVSNFVKRSITGSLFVIVLVGSILLGKITFYILFATITYLGLSEFYGLVQRKGVRVQSVLGIITGVTLFTLSFLISANVLMLKYLYVLIPLFIGVYIIELFRNLEHPFINIAFTFLGIIYIALPFSLMNFIIFPSSNWHHYDPQMVLGFFLMIWASDTGAYLVGMAIGKHKLFERISPKKTWEGFAGGMIFSVLAALVISKYFPAISDYQWTLMAFIVFLFGSFGDLSESLLKRSMQIKDSGNILPGHGGILDRFDSVLMAAPMVFVYLQLIR